MAENIQLAFNSQLNLRTAYDWDRSQVYHFLQDVVSNPNQYGVPATNVQELKRIRTNLLRLSLVNGNNYRAGPALQPDQHIYRILNRNWIPRRPDRSRRDRPPLEPQPRATNSKFRLRKHIHNGREYWCPYDLLGLFLSIMGPAPPEATKRSFFLPITAVFGRWCRQIAGKPSGGVGDLPYVFQCTWRIRPNQPTQFFLGASLAGYEWDSWLTGNWQWVLKRARFDLLDVDRLEQEGYNFDHPVRGPKHVKFGNCAETYPFLELLMNHNPNTESCHGLALQRDYLDTDGYQDTLSGDVWTRVWGPCANCRFLIRLYNGDGRNFAAGTGCDGAPL